MKEKNNKKTIPYNERLKAFIKRDFLYIVLMLMALLVCLYTILNIGEYQNKCNTYWYEQIKNKCSCGLLDPYLDNHTLILLNINIPIDKQNTTNKNLSINNLTIDK